MFAAGNENKEFSAYPACYAPTVSVAAWHGTSVRQVIVITQNG